MLALPHALRLAGVEVQASTAPRGTRRASFARLASSHARGPRAVVPSRGRRTTRRASLTSPRAAGDGESFLDKINPFKKSKSAELAKREADANALINDDTRKQLFGDGLVGKMVSGMINQAASGLKQQMSAAAEATEVTYDSAVRACKMDGRVRSALGDDVQATPQMSQMSSSTNVNGVASQQTSVGFMQQSQGSGCASHSRSVGGILGPRSGSQSACWTQSSRRHCTSSPQWTPRLEKAMPAGNPMVSPTRYQVKLQYVRVRPFTDRSHSELANESHQSSTDSKI